MSQVGASKHGSASIGPQGSTREPTDSPAPNSGPVTHPSDILKPTRSTQNINSQYTTDAFESQLQSDFRGKVLDTSELATNLERYCNLSL